jgi:hypothetical protein
MVDSVAELIAELVAELVAELAVLDVVVVVDLAVILKYWLFVKEDVSPSRKRFM